MNLRQSERIRTIEEYLEQQNEQYGEFVDCQPIRHLDDGHDRMEDDEEIELLHVEEI